MTEPSPVPAPKGLNPGGRRFWKAVAVAYTLRPDELILLENACRTIDRVAELDAAMVGQPLVTRGSMGQNRENPLLAESRLQRTLLRQTLAQLKLPDINGNGEMNQHRSAAQSRWARAHGGGKTAGWEYGK